MARDGALALIGVSLFVGLHAHGADAGTPAPPQATSPTPVDAGQRTCRVVKDLVAGREHTCALFDDGAMKCWGANDKGQLGQGDAADRGDGPGDEMGERLSPVNLGKNKRVIEIGAMNDYACARLGDKSIKCWGESAPRPKSAPLEDSRVGDHSRDMGDRLGAVSVWPFTHFNLTSSYQQPSSYFAYDSRAYGYLSCTVRPQAPEMICDHGKSRMGGFIPAGSVDLSADEMPVSLAVGGRSICMISKTGLVTCFDIQPRDDNLEEAYRHRKVIDLGPGRTAKVVIAGSGHACALLDDGSVKCWGRNDRGQLGRNLHLGDEADNREPRHARLGTCAETATPEPSLHEAFLVIAAGSKDKERAAKLFAQWQNRFHVYKSHGLSTSASDHLVFRLVESATVRGLNPGFWIVALGAVRPEATAKRFAQWFGKGAYYRKVFVQESLEAAVWPADTSLEVGTVEAAKQRGIDLNADIAPVRQAAEGADEAEQAEGEREAEEWQRIQNMCTPHCGPVCPDGNCAGEPPE